MEDRRLLSAAGIETTLIGDPVTKEDGTSAAFRVALESQPTDPVTVSMQSDDPTEGVVFFGGELIFTVGEWNMPQIVMVTGVDDAEADGQQSYAISLLATSDDLDYYGYRTQVSLSNVDDDAAGLALVPTGVLVTSEDGESSVLKVFLNTEPTADVTVEVSSSNDKIGAVSPGNHTFDATNWDQPWEVTVTGVDDDPDAIDPGGYTEYSVTVAVTASGDAAYAALPSEEVTVFNRDDDMVPGITVAPSTGLVTSESGARVTFSVVLDTPPTADVRIPIVSEDTTEGTVSVDALIFTSANWSTPQDVVVTGVDDGSVVNTPALTPYSVRVGPAESDPASGGDPLYDGLDPDDVSLKNADNDQAHPDVQEFMQGPTWWALKSQRDLAINEPLSNVMHLGTHNSFNTVEDGFGEWPGKNPNQIYSMRNQLEAGVRLLELDIHDVDSPSNLLLVHANAISTETSLVVDPFGVRRLSAAMDQDLVPWIETHPDEVILIVVQEVDLIEGDTFWVSMFEDRFGTRAQRATTLQDGSRVPNANLLQDDGAWKSRRELVDDGVQVIFEELRTFENTFCADNKDHVGNFTPLGEENLTRFEITYGDGFKGSGAPPLTADRLAGYARDNVNIMRMDFVLGKEGSHSGVHAKFVPYPIHLVDLAGAESDLPLGEYFPVPLVIPIPPYVIPVVGPSLYNLPTQHSGQRGDRLQSAVWSWQPGDPGPMRQPNGTLGDGNDVAVQGAVELLDIPFKIRNWQSQATTDSSPMPFALRSVHRYDVDNPDEVNDLQGNFKWTVSSTQSTSWFDFMDIPAAELTVNGVEYEFAAPVNGLQNDVLYAGRTAATSVWMKANDLDRDGVWSLDTDFLSVYLDASDNLVIRDLVVLRDPDTGELSGNDDLLTITIDSANDVLVVYQGNPDYPVVASVGVQVDRSTVRVPLSAFSGEIQVLTELGFDSASLETGSTNDNLVLKQDGPALRLQVNTLAFVTEDVEALALATQAGNDTLTLDSTTDPLTVLTTLHGGANTDTVAATRDTDFFLTDAQLSVTGVGSISLQSVEAAALAGGPGDNGFVFAFWTGSATTAGGDGDDRYVFGPTLLPGTYTIVELPGGGDDVVDFRVQGPDSPALALDWMNPAADVTGTSLASHPAVGSVSVGVEGQQENLEYGMNVTPHLDPIDGDRLGVRCEPIPYSVRFVDVGTKMTHTAEIVWGDGNGEPGAVSENPATTEGLVESIHAYTELGTYRIDVTVTDHAPDWLWMPGAGWWETSASVTTEVEILPAVVKPDPQRPGELALFVGGTLWHDAITVTQWYDGSKAVVLNGFWEGLYRPTDGGHVNVFTCEGFDVVVLSWNVPNDANVFSGPGHDVVLTGSGNDMIDAGPGNDVIYGLYGDDLLLGGGRIDVLFGMDGNDVLYGGPDLDVLYGGFGTDELYGEGGNDVLVGGPWDEGDLIVQGSVGGTHTPENAAVVGRHVFYNNSAFDGADSAADARDDAAIATDKMALPAGRPATQDHYTNYAGGINGIMVDVAGLPDDYTPVVEDFSFRVGNDSDPSGWRDAPNPTLTLRPDAGEGGSDRVTFVWDDGAIRNEWLEVTVRADRLGLPVDDVFYFGNAVAEAGNSADDARVTTTDLLLTRNNPRDLIYPAEVDFSYDFNRDRRVDATDVLLARNNQTGFLSALELIDVPSAVAESPAEEACELAWLYDVEQTDAEDRTDAQPGSVEAAIDKLLAM